MSPATSSCDARGRCASTNGKMGIADLVSVWCAWPAPFPRFCVRGRWTWKDALVPSHPFQRASRQPGATSWGSAPAAGMGTGRASRCLALHPPGTNSRPVPNDLLLFFVSREAEVNAAARLLGQTRDRLSRPTPPAPPPGARRRRSWGFFATRAATRWRTVGPGRGGKSPSGGFPLVLPAPTRPDGQEPP
jgi:hypothetical protein